MIKRIANLPFTVLGALARAVERHEERKQRQAAPPPSTYTNVPGLDVPPDFDTGPLALAPSALQALFDGHSDVTLVDIRDQANAPLPDSLAPTTLRIPSADLGIRLAELPPAGHRIVACCDDGSASRKAARFLRFRGIDDAWFLDGGLAAWRASGGTGPSSPETP